MSGARRTAVAAVDLGATSGRVIVAKVGQNTLDMRTVTRFANTPVRTIDGLHWNVLELYRSAMVGLGTALREEPELSSIGIDSWAVDYALLRGERMLGTPFHYRDERTQRGVEAAHALVPPADLYARNGLQFLPFNSLYQLTTDRLDGALEVADGALLIPDLFTFWLTGRRVAERSNASTTGLLSVTSRQWDAELLARLKLPASILPPLVDAGERIGALLPSVAAELGATRQIDVIAVGSHDTASAVLAVPMQAERAAYISCGTWGLVGLELERPVLSEAARSANFTNEGGVDGTVRFLHNVMGLWLLSESLRSWEKADGLAIDLVELLAAAAAVTTPVSVFDANDPRFMAPGDLPRRIAEFCTERGLAVPEGRAQIVRSIIESLAQAFADAVRTAQRLADRPVDVVHIVGGGSQNELLCQLTADRLGTPVLAGPVEATAIGNVLVQARAQGFVAGGLSELRQLVAANVQPRGYEPRSGR
jgi:rhamnulokinase